MLSCFQYLVGALLVQKRLSLVLWLVLGLLHANGILFSYLRVSNEAPDTVNQKHGVLRYCIDKHLLEPVFIEGTASGKTD